MTKDFLNIKIPKGTKIAVVGDIHEHEKQFDMMVEKIQPSETMKLVSVNDIYDKGYGRKTAESITRKMRTIVESGNGYIIKGNHELKAIRKARKNSDLATDEIFWIKDQPLALSFVFSNETRVTVVHGGVTPLHTWKDLKTNAETAYVRTVDENGKFVRLLWVKKDNGDQELVPDRPGRSWHEIYDGRFGYIAAGHDAQKDGVAKFFDYSCNLDSCCYETGILTAQVFSEHGLEDLVTVKAECSGFKSNGPS